MHIPHSVGVWVVLCEVVVLHLVGVTFLLRNTCVFAVHVFCHDWDEVQAVGLHLEAGNGLVFVSPDVDGVVGVDGTGQVEGHAQGDSVTGPQTLRGHGPCFSSGALQLLFFWDKIQGLGCIMAIGTLSVCLSSILFFNQLKDVSVLENGPYFYNLNFI